MQGMRELSMRNLGTDDGSKKSSSYQIRDACALQVWPSSEVVWTQFFSLNGLSLAVGKRKYKALVC